MSGRKLAGFFGVIMIAGGLGRAGDPVYALTAPPAPRPHKVSPAVETICVEIIHNMSHQPVNMEGIDDELVAQLQRIGFQATRTSAPGGKRCDATINGELVDITGRRRKTARVDFRLTLAGEEPPRIAASAYGNSSRSPSMVLSIVSNFRPMEFASSQSKPDRTMVEREAIVAALADQARQIKVAYQRGLPPWLPAAQ